MTDVPGSKLDRRRAARSQTLPLDATTEMRVKLTGLTRDSEKITALAGVFTVTAADKMLRVRVRPNPAANSRPPDAPERVKSDGVTATLKRVQKKDDTWEVEVEVTYPPNQPVFESFQGEWWLRDNRLTVRVAAGQGVRDRRLRDPDAGQPPPAAGVSPVQGGRREGPRRPDGEGVGIVYETPSPLAEVKVPFELKDIPLP